MVLKRHVSHKTNEDSTEAASNPTPARTPAPARLYGIIGQGQSLSVGVQAALNEETAAAPGGFRLDDSTDNYDITNPDAACLQLAPLTEPLRRSKPPVGAYPDNIAGKTPHSSMAAQIHFMARRGGAADADGANADGASAHCAAGISGAPMAAICKGGVRNAYAASLFEARALARLARGAGAELAVDAVVLTHGETDAVLGNDGYGGELVRMQADYAADVREITGQWHEPVLILSQQQGIGFARDKWSHVVQQQWQAPAASANAVVCAGPKYQYDYAPGNLHFLASGYDRLGEKYGQVFYQTVVEKRPFVPLSPKQVSFEAPGKIVVKFHVPVPPLQWDDVLPAPHQDVVQGVDNTAWKHGRGFEVVDANRDPIGIARVAINGDGESVTIELAPSYKGRPAYVAYAMTADAPGVGGGTAEGLMGHLCDSDQQVGAGAELLECAVTNGSSEIFCEDKFRRRAKYDLVDPGGFVIADLCAARPRRAWLNRPWRGPSGKQALFFTHNHRNYLVSFWLKADCEDGAVDGAGPARPRGWVQRGKSFLRR